MTLDKLPMVSHTVQALREAQELQQKGRYDDAARLYRQALVRDPRNARAIHYLGMTQYQMGEKLLGRAYVDQSIVIAPQYSMFLLNRGSLYEESSNNSAARKDFARAITLNPTLETAYEKLAWLLFRIQNYFLAKACFTNWLILNPCRKEGWLGLAVLLREQRDFQAALRAANNCLAIERFNQDALTQIGMIHDVLGDWCSATENFARYSLLEPNRADGMFSLATIAFKRKDYALAISTLFRVSRIDPYYLKGVDLLAAAFEHNGDADQALNWAFRSRAIDPSIADTDIFIAIILVRCGRFAEAWRFYRSRWRSEHLIRNAVLTPMLATTRPEYDASASPSRVLIWGEQGIGDEIMFGSLIGEFLSRCGSVVLQIDRRLIGLFARAFPGATIYERGEKVPEKFYDHHLPIGDLVNWVRPTKDSFEGKGRSYLRAKDGLALQLRRDLGVFPEERLIGLSWRSAAPGGGSARSMALSTMVEAFRALKGIRFMVLQYDDFKGEIDSLKRDTGESILFHPDIDYRDNLEGVSALIQSCNLVVSIGNSTAHLSGALGQRTWVLLPKTPGWRWIDRAGRCIWYESVRLFPGAVDLSGASLRGLLPMHEV